MQAYVNSVLQTLSTGRPVEKRCSFAAERESVLAVVNTRLDGTPLSKLLAHVPRYRNVTVCGHAAGRCPVTGVQSTRLIALRFCSPHSSADAPAFCCVVDSSAVRAVRYYYAWYYFPEIVLLCTWQRTHDAAALDAAWQWLRDALLDLATFIDQ